MLIRCSISPSWKLKSIDPLFPLSRQGVGLFQFHTQVSWFPTQQKPWTLAHPFAYFSFSTTTCKSYNIAHRPCPWSSIYFQWKPQFQDPLLNLHVTARDLTVCSSGIWWWGLCGLLAIYALILGGFLRADSWNLFINIGSILVEQRGAWYYRMMIAYEARKTSVSICPDTCFPNKQEYSWCVCILSPEGKPQFLDPR